ncbi:MAG: protein translocase subunit SecD [Firmicutes bacterium]|nr:protein translocase subunit SecD [Bacillota bacterium]
MNNNNGINLVIVLIVLAAAVFFSITPLAGINLGLDLQGGLQVVLEAVPNEGSTSISADDMSKLTEVMRRRVDEFGVSEPILQREGADRLIIELAGVDEPEKAVEMLGVIAQLEFRDPNGNVILTGADLSDAKATINNSASVRERNQVSLTFSSQGTELFKNATATFLRQHISIYLDDKLISDPVVNSVIPNGQAVISGGFDTFEEASQLAALLRGGSLPVGIEILSKRTVGPTLGQDSLEKSLFAAIIGLIILGAFMILYYRVPGTWACISLVVYALILLWVLNLIKATLTLTSIAGFILSIGMAVDANIIIYERIKEELFSGKSLKASIESGFKRAFTTILDSNLTTLIAAVVLYYFGSGSIRGFALTLSIGLVASMFTAISFTRYMLRWTSDITALAKKSFFGLRKKYRKFKVDFIGKQKVFYAISLLVIIPGLVCLFLNGLNLGIDFTGGNILQIQYDQKVDQAQVRDIVNGFVSQTPSIQQSEDNQFLIRTEILKAGRSGEEGGDTQLIEALGALGKVTVLRNEFIGPIIGAELLSNARWALLIAAILMLAYITLRFQLNFAITAVMALLHDALIVLSIFAIFRIEVDSAFIAAILTIIGYSINNTIVVFDRIRENVHHQERMTARDLINLSINQTFTRSVNTVLAVLFLLFSLLILGGETTKIFMLALAVGMVAGFFSSLCLVGNFLEQISRKNGLSVGKSKAAVRVRTAQK